MTPIGIGHTTGARGVEVCRVNVEVSATFGIDALFDGGFDIEPGAERRLHVSWDPVLTSVAVWSESAGWRVKDVERTTVPRTVAVQDPAGLRVPDEEEWEVIRQSDIEGSWLLLSYGASCPLWFAALVAQSVAWLRKRALARAIASGVGRPPGGTVSPYDEEVGR